MATPKKSAVPEGELLDRAFTVAVRHRWRYPGHATRDGALACLKRGCRGFTAPRYERALDRANDLYQRTIEIVHRHFSRFPEMDQWRPEDVPRDIIDALRQRVPGFRVSTYRYAVGCVLDWHHWR